MNAHASGSRSLLRGVGYAGIALVVLNGMIGAGIFALPMRAAANVGPWSPWLFLVIGFLIISVVVTFARLASFFDGSGGPVLYTGTAFGPLVGFSTGWILYVSRVTAFAANSTVMADYLGAVWPAVGGGTGRILLIVVICGSITLANYVGVKDGVRTVGLFTILKITPILILILMGLPYVSPETMWTSQLPTYDALSDTTLLLIYAFVGFESGTIISGETIDPRRTMPRALVMSVAATGILYFLIVLVYVSVLPGEQSEGATLIDLGRVLGGSAGALIITLTAVFSIGGNLSTIMLAVPRLTFALGEQRLLPGWFSRVHDKFSTPGNSILFLGGLALAFALSGTFESLLAASVLTRLISYILCIAALPSITKNADEESRANAYKLFGGYAIPVFALLLCLWITAQASVDAWVLTGQMLAVGLLLYWVARQRRGRPIVARR